MNYLIFPVLLGLGLAGCSQSPTENPATTPETASAPPTDRADRSAPGLAATGPARPVAPAAPAAPDRSVIYQGEMDLAVDSFEQASASIDQLLDQQLAYLVTAHETRANGQHRQTMTLKAAPQDFPRLVATLGKLGRIESKDVSSADATADLLAADKSLATRQATEARLLQLLAKTSNPAEVRRLEEQTQQLRQEVAADQSHLQQLGAQTTWATLTLRFYQALPDAAPSEPAISFAPQFAEAFNRGWSAVLAVLVVVTNIWPLLVLGGLGAWATRWWRLRQAARA